MDSPSGSGDVISIRARGRPDYKKLASGQVLAARERLDVSHAEFAAFLGDLLGWLVTPEAVERWERGSIPPGDVLLACAVITQETPGDVLAFPVTATAVQTAALLSSVGNRSADTLLESVPHGFPAEALCGPWVTCYQFTHGGVLHHHVDVAHIAAESDRHIRAVNHPPMPRTEGRTSPFRNEIEAQLVSRHLVGHWRNTSDTRYFGSVHLAVLPGEIVMEGYYTGFASDILVSTGWWKWVRLEAESISGIVPPQLRLRDPSVLHELVMNHSQFDVPLTLTDIGEDT